MASGQTNYGSREENALSIQLGGTFKSDMLSSKLVDYIIICVGGGGGMNYNHNFEVIQFIIYPYFYSFYKRLNNNTSG